MKKNISINISGIIFHIEEDGYEELKKYLESINRYFSTFEDSKEIIDDIENRIAEIFLAKLKDGKQVITAIDVNDLIATMGSVADFEAIEEQELPEERLNDEPKKQEKSEKKQKEEKKEEHRAPGLPKRLYRDEKRKILGGVASGIAHYFGIDALWVRLLFLLLLLNYIIPELSGVVLLAYIILWVIVPGSPDLDEDKKIKKLFRDSEDRVFGGVASGVASYFGADATLIRILFIVVTLLGVGTGIIIYIILWIITPSAVSITDKIQMKGDPVTLTNIETSIKKNLNVNENEDENVLVKIILFPFRLIAAVFKGLGKILGPSLKFLAEALRIFAGFIIVLVGIVTIVALIISFGVVFGLYDAPGAQFSFFEYGFPMELIQQSFSTLSILAFFILLTIPFLGLTFLGITVITKRRSSTPAVNWAMFSVWVASILVIAFTIPPIFLEFREKATVKESLGFDINGTPVLNLSNKDHSNYEEIDLKLRGYDGDQLKVVKYAYSQGSTTNIAEKNAKNIKYNILNKDSVFFFDPSLSLPSGERFRMQELDIIIYIPYDQPFVITESIKGVLDNRGRFSSSYYYFDQLGEQTWVFSSKKGLTCLSCEESRDKDIDKSDYFDGTVQGDDSESLSIGDFESVEIDGNFIIKMRESENYEIELKGNESYFEEVVIYNDNGILKINSESGNRFKKWKLLESVEVVIGSPSLERINVEGNSIIDLDYSDLNELQITLEGNSKMKAHLEAEGLDIRMRAASKLELHGNGDVLKIKMSGASDLDSFDYDVEEVDITTLGSANANVFADQYFDADASGLSRIKYRGNPKTDLSEGGNGSIVRD
ncbi:MAG: PspC domain-containing protein [Bacteroidota bacterium]